MAERARGAGGGAAVCGPHGGAGDACCAARPAGRGPRLCRGVEGFGIACVHFLPPASRRRCGAALLAAIPVCPSDAGPRPAASVRMSLRPSARAMSARVRLICRARLICPCPPHLPAPGRSSAPAAIRPCRPSVRFVQLSPAASSSSSYSNRKGNGKSKGKGNGKSDYKSKCNDKK